MKLNKLQRGIWQWRRWHSGAGKAIGNYCRRKQK